MKRCAILLLLAVLTVLPWTSCRKDGTIPEEDEVMSDPETMETDLPVSEPDAESLPASEPEAAETEAPAEAAGQKVNKAQSNDYAPAYTVIRREGFTDDSVGTFVAAYDLSEYGADATGQTDCTGIIQKLLDKLGSLGGGTLYIPEGFYRINGHLTIHRGVTIRGDWKKPEPGSPVEGTVLMAYTGRGKGANAESFIDMELGAGIMDAAIWYPEQTPDNITEYSPTIKMGVNNYFGNEYNNVKNVTFVNCWRAVHFSYTNGGASPVVNGCYGTPLYMGVEVDNIADVGRVENVHFSPAYWIGCGLYEKLGLEDPFVQPQAQENLRTYLYENAVGLIMRRNDWSYASYISVEGYSKGFAAMPSVGSPGSTPNGHNYAFDFTGCKIGISIEASNSVGIMFTNIRIRNSETGIWIAPGTTDAAQFTDCTLDAKKALVIDPTSDTKVLMTACVIESGEVLAEGGTLNITDSDFHNTDAPEHIRIGSGGRANIVGNRFDGEAKITNHSFFRSNIDHTPLKGEKLPAFARIQPEEKLPAKFDLFLVTDFGAKEGLRQPDNTDAFQKALDAAQANGGGIVFVPAGHWNLEKTLRIPTGVELRGACDNSTTPHGDGTIFESKWGRGDFSADPFLSVEARGGLKNITINYPDQIYSDSKNWKPDEYPWAIRGLGSGIYIVNVGVRACYAALDLFTCKCDGFYVDFLAGHMFNYGVKIGGGSENGYLANVMCNTIVYAAGRESKFGSFPNSPESYKSNSPIYDYGYANLEFFILGDTKNLTMYNCFNFGAYSGIRFISEGSGGPTGISLGLGLDADEKAFYLEKGVTTKGFTFINTQFVSLGQSEIYYIYAEPESSFDVKLFASDYWGGPTCGVFLGENSGTVELIGAHFMNPGNTAFADLRGGRLSIQSSNINHKDPLLNRSKGSEYLEVTASIADAAGVRQNQGIWENNLSSSREFSSEGVEAEFDRSKWRARASHNSGAARRAFDGDIGTRWDTAKVQEPGMWFEVDFREPLTFDTLILDIGSSTGDAPREFSVYVQAEGEDGWSGPIASGAGGSGIMNFEPVTASRLRIEQNGQSSSNYWSIHEMYVANSK